MKKIIQSIGIFALLLSSSACQRDEGIQVRSLRYEVDIFGDNKVGISYLSDFFYANETLNEVIVNDTAVEAFNRPIWRAARNDASEDHNYLIRVDFKNYSNPNQGEHGVRVFANDTFLLDEIRVTNVTGILELSGEIPNL